MCVCVCVCVCVCILFVSLIKIQYEIGKWWGLGEFAVPEVTVWFCLQVRYVNIPDRSISWIEQVKLVKLVRVLSSFLSTELVLRIG